MIRNLLFVIFLSLFLPSLSWAAILYLEPDSGGYYQGDTFIIAVRIDAEKECINTVSANLTFPHDILQAVDFSQGDSILTLWVNPPSINQGAGTISFTGGIPGGYCGRIPGDPGESNLLGKIIFKVKAVGEQFSDTATVEFLASSQALLNDGFGTPAELETKDAVFNVLAVTAAAPKQEWQEELIKDTIPPEVFKIEINQDPSIFEGKYFIVFSTTDKQTGIDYYEVKEGERDWQKTVSPYLLNDQSLQSIIEARATDKAGNFIIIEYLPISVKTKLPYWIIPILFALLAIWWAVKRFLKRR